MIPVKIAGFRESRKAIATLLGYLEEKGIDYPVTPVILKNKQKPEINEGEVLSISFLSIRWKEIKTLIEEVKGKVSMLIAGGPHPAGRWKELLDSGFDIVATGEGEESFTGIIELLQGKREIEEVPGICYKINGNVKCNEQHRLTSLDQSPGFSIRHRIFPSIEVTRGCPYLCQYCQTPVLMGRRPRHRSMEDLERIVKFYLEIGKKDFRFITPNAFGYLDSSPNDWLPFVSMVKMLYRAVRGKGRLFIGSFPSEVRPDYVTPEKVETVKKFCANDNIVVGAQSGSNRILKKMKRAHTVEDVIRAVKIIVDNGLTANVDFIFGNPGEEEEDIEATIELMEKLIEMGAKIHGHYFMPLPGTPWENEKPVIWPKKYIRKLGEMARRGLLYGSWTHQMKFTEIV